MPKTTRRTARLLTQAEAAKHLGVAIRTLQVYVQQREIRCVRKPVVGRRMAPFFQRSELDRFLQAQERRAS